MDFLELVKTRRSIRSFLPKEVDQDKIDFVLKCASLAPSAVNFQPWRYYVVKSEEKRKALYSCYTRDWFAQAPLYIVICVNIEESWKRKDGKDHADIDAAITTEHICLAATECGLGSCWVCNFDTEICAKVLSLPFNEKPVAIVPLGYPATLPEKATQRKPLSEMLKYV